MPARSRWLGGMGALLILLGGCATRGPLDDPATTRQLGFLQPGEVTRSEVEARLGPPDQTYEVGRLVTYTVAEKDGRLSTAFSLHGPIYTLVIEYAPDGKIVRRSLVRRPQ